MRCCRFSTFVGCRPVTSRRCSQPSWAGTRRTLSPAVITRLTAEWQADYDAWQKRELSARRYVYVWADGVYLQARMEEAAGCMLVLIGATPEGKKELVGFQTGVRESAQSWRELLVDIKQRVVGIVVSGSDRTPVGRASDALWSELPGVFPRWATA
jgi:putative transposase